MKDYYETTVLSCCRREKLLFFCFDDFCAVADKVTNMFHDMYQKEISDKHDISLSKHY